MIKESFEELFELSKEELKAVAKRLGISFDSNILKPDLIGLINKYQRQIGEKVGLGGNNMKLGKFDETSVLMRRKKDELISMVKNLGGKVSTSMTKADLVELIEKLTLASKPKQTKKKDAYKEKKSSERVQIVGDVITEAPTAPPSNGAHDFKETIEKSRFAATSQHHEDKSTTVKVRHSKEQMSPMVHFTDEELPFPQWEGVSVIYLLPRDNRWIFATWEIDWQGKKRLLRNETPSAVVMNIYDYGPEESPWLEPSVTHITINEQTDNWFFDTGVENHIFEAEIGYVVKGKYKPLVRSNRVFTARAFESDDTRAFFVSIPPHISLSELRRRLAEMGIDRRFLALELYRLGMGQKAPDDYMGYSAELAELSRRLRKEVEKSIPASSLAPYAKR